MKVDAAAQHKPKPTRQTRRTVGVALAGVAVAGLLVVLQPWRASDTYATNVGELRTVILEDGTRMSLNTSTRVRVALASAQRRVSVEEGEALFEVAKDPLRPFVVLVADREVVALGTVFSVRLTPTGEIGSSALDVTLIEGQVSVRAASGTSNKAAEMRPVLLKPGDRLRLSEPGGKAAKGSQRVPMQMDRPQVDQLMAWRRNEAVFDDAPLSDAVAEMNRYSRQPIVMVGPDSFRRLRISGLFRTGDNVAFARAVAALHGLVVHDRQDHVELGPSSGG
jgi:transmembrane sensor